MSIISDAILQQLMGEGVPILLIPSDFKKKKPKEEEELEIPEEVEILPTRLTRNQPRIAPVIPSPKPG